MKTLGMQPSRRQFIQQLGLGVAWLGLATNASLVFANRTAILPFRQQRSANLPPLASAWPIAKPRAFLGSLLNFVLPIPRMTSPILSFFAAGEPFSTLVMNI